jgi:hypothetical protein
MEMLGILLGIVGILVGIYFGVRSVFQSSDIEVLQRAQRANTQTMYNHFWRIATLCSRIGSGDDAIVEARRIGTAMNEITIAARTQLVSFSREHNLFIPIFEEPWKPIEILPLERPRPLWRRLFFLSEPTRLPLVPIERRRTTMICAMCRPRPAVYGARQAAQFGERRL